MKRSYIHKNSLAFDILKIAAAATAAGALIFLFAALPGLPVALAPFLKDERGRLRRFRDIERRRIAEVVRRLRTKHLVEVVGDGQKLGLRITKEGKSVLKFFELEEMRLPAFKHWDEKWRMVAFDIPERHKKAREALRERLSALGFQRLQKSLWVYPYDCRDEIDFITHIFLIHSYVHYLVCDSLENKEVFFRKRFNLL